MIEAQCRNDLHATQWGPVDSTPSPLKHTHTQKFIELHCTFADYVSCHHTQARVHF